jgi:hypothetical protein
LTASEEMEEKKKFKVNVDNYSKNFKNKQKEDRSE